LAFGGRTAGKTEKVKMVPRRRTCRGTGLLLRARYTWLRQFLQSNGGAKDNGYIRDVDLPVFVYVSGGQLGRGGLQFANSHLESQCGVGNADFAVTVYIAWYDSRCGWNFFLYHVAHRVDVHRPSPLLSGSEQEPNLVHVFQGFTQFVGDWNYKRIPTR
jgi:hypothetical protein